MIAATRCMVKRARALFEARSMAAPSSAPRTPPLASHPPRAPERPPVEAAPLPHAPIAAAAVHDTAHPPLRVSDAGILSLTPEERRLFALLVDSMRSSAAKSHVTMRIAGGWVRDRLLGVHTADIDVALEGCSVQEYVQLLHRGFHADDEDAGEEEGKKRLRTFLVQSNPEKSRHLDTVKARVLDMDVDIVHLRREDYSEHSRIPEAASGTPWEDARRRDFTVNALFYNLHTQRVEDYIGRGLADLKDELLDTPIEPMQTLLDDPLRMLRGLRLHCQLGFRLADRFLEAAASPEVREALSAKVSRERIGIETQKMLSTARGQQGVALLERLGLLEVIFNQTQLEGMTGRVQRAGALLDELDRDGGVAVDADLRFRTLVPAALLPLSTNEMEKCVNEALKWPKAARKIYAKVTADARELVVILRTFSKSVGPGRAPEVSDDYEFTMALRLWFYRTASADWIPRLAVAHVLLDGEVVALRGVDFARRVEKERLVDAVTIQPLIKGVAIKQSIGSGPMVKIVKDEMIEWQMRNPNATADDAKQWLRSRNARLKTSSAP